MSASLLEGPSSYRLHHISLVQWVREQTLILARAFGSHSNTNVPVYILRRMFSAWAETEL